MGTQSLGLIETWGMVPAVEAADAATKAADVTFFGYERVEAGLVTVMFAGDVAAVQAAVAAGRAAAEKVGRVIAAHVIPRPDRQIPWKPRGVGQSEAGKPRIEASPLSAEAELLAKEGAPLSEGKSEAPQEAAVTKEMKKRPAKEKSKPRKGKKS